MFTNINEIYLLHKQGKISEAMFRDCLETAKEWCEIYELELNCSLAQEVA